MGGSYSDVSVEDLLKVIKGFIEMLILASGYQSSGRLAHWDSHNIKQAFQWAVFIEDVLRCWKSSDDHQDPVAKLDLALLEINSSPSFPQGLQNLTSTSLSQARCLILSHLIHTLPLRDTHLRATIAAIVEVDFQELQSLSGDALHVYVDRFILDATKTTFPTGRITLPGQCTRGSSEAQPGMDKISLKGGFTRCAVQELATRQLELSHLTVAEAGLDVLSRIVRNSNSNELGTTLCGKKPQLMKNVMVEERAVEPEVWSLWKSRALSYLLDNRTIRLVSGAKLLLSAPKHQWVEVLRRMAISDETDDYYEKIELLLSGSIGSKWSSLIEKVISSSYKSVTISKLYREVQDLLFRRSQNPCFEEHASTEEKGALEYLEDVLTNKVHCLLKLLPIIPAAAISLRSPLLKSYLIELESRMRGDSSAIRCCNCVMDGKNHTECEVAERIWCLYIFHACGSWVERRVPVKCFQGSYHVAKRLVWRFKSEWKPIAQRWQRSSTSRYSYDAQSYSQNFDDGCSDEHRSPLAPSPR
ncbi:OLC1v1006939C1 [Oldenlandia corymbosa var. corymbosa]|uniref:OLC1v1006939C1 n=1 Tax=Oldenlandia corymbosa var. corymbosa TaxID=529605 RepID=A0AAV1DI67_OLDCO|nr:OLC1v1006939C1 [Oldenlandia corymbosa var. corymbosa]